ncbi:MAG: chitobiase/beta-hexosaminidase C-terminal domain-containing protein [Saprospiraceae bacterium]|nr:chitobiase/beta-hexosaminidase C-terminal domain-containing protein [Saprospiraceae bacterium]MCB9319628.1 chitobiase/beta-hexosaminidase C-terminal domain-containing protein [Lewinellaceae bacterium]
MSWLEFLGRFHPVLLHLPIGLLIGAFGLELIQRKSRSAGMNAAIQSLLFWGMVTAIVTALLGFFLQWEGGYEERLLNIHKYLGISTAVLSVVVYLLKKTTTDHRAYLPVFGLTTTVMLLAGHFGGSLTHGSSYLSDQMPNGLRSLLGLPPKSAPVEEITSVDASSLVFQDVIQPIFRSKCTSCHNPEKAKGELLLHNQEGVEKGGKDGALFIAGDVENSLLIKRILLPLDNEDHMPPEGKKQLTEDEVALMEWWINNHRSYEDRIQDVSVPDNIQAVFAKSVKPENPVFRLDLKDPGEKKLTSLRNEGVKVMRLAAENPLLEINMSYRQDLEPDFLKKLFPIADQIAYLNLSKSNVTDDMIRDLGRFPHLVRLYLDNTSITDAGLESLKGLEYLQYLNLYGTGITDAGLTHLESLPHLEELYLWQSQVSDAGVEALQAKIPGLEVNTGITGNNLGGVIPLQAPVIQVDETLFTDSVQVQLILNVDGIRVYYTLDGSDPDTTSNLYSKPVTIKRTTEIRTFATKPGWQSSPVGSKQLIRSKYRPQDVTLNVPPNPKYQASGPSTLIDFNKGSNQFGDGQWLGFEKQDVTATLDMGSAVPLSHVTISCLENASSWIFFPRGIQVEVSSDARNWKNVVRESYPEATEAASPALKNFLVTFPEQNARYVRVKITGQKTNPRWHPNPGEPCWLFMDEILVD